MEQPSNPYSRPLRFILFIVLAALFLFLGKLYSFNEQAFRSYLSHFPLLLSCVIFVVLYFSLTFFIWIGPKDILRIVGALLYGPYLSTLLVWIGEMFNLVLLFSLSRRLGRDYVEAKLKGRMKQVDQAIADSSCWWIAFLRMTPIVPFRFQDLGFGLTKISLRKFFFIALLASPPRVFFLQFFLSLGLETALSPKRLTDYLTVHPQVFFWTFAYLAISVIMLIVFRKKLRRA